MNLEEAGHTVVALHSSDDALSKIKEHTPDCVLTDIMMPGIDGMQLGADSFITKPIDAETFSTLVEDVMADLLQIRFWGVRGTLPVSGHRSLRYGGNTSCVTLEFPRGQQFIFDAGSASRNCRTRSWRRRRK